MAKSFSTQTINGLLHELHPTEVNKQGIGLVPCLSPQTLEDLGDYTVNGVMTESDIIACFKSGHTVNQQARARAAVTGGKTTPNSAETAEIFNKLCEADPETVTKYVGRGDALLLAIRDYWKTHYSDGKKSVEVSATKVWTELAFKPVK